MRSRAFTLVELLAVVAVIGVLAALLLPAMAKVKLRMQVTQNLSALRQIQAANIVYAADHDGWYVTLVGFDSNGATTSFWYTDQNFRKNYLSIPITGAWPANLLSPRSTLRSSTGVRNIAYSYGMNIETLTAGGAYGTPNLVRRVRSTQVSAPAETIALADAVDWQIDYTDAFQYQGVEVYIPRAMAYRYEGKAGAVFYDGHAAMLSEADTADRNLWSIKR